MGLGIVSEQDESARQHCLVTTTGILSHVWFWWTLREGDVSVVEAGVIAGMCQVTGSCKRYPTKNSLWTSWYAGALHEC